MDEKFDHFIWEQFEKDCLKIAFWAKHKDFKNVYGIPRGGLILAVKLSHVLDLPLILSKQDIMKKTLIVDDIVDTGKTIERLFFSLGHKPQIASLYLGPEAKIKPNFFLHKKKKWIVFPWETNKSSKYDNTSF